MGRIEMADTTCFLYNAQSNASSGLAPNEVMFGTQLRTRVDAALRLGGMESFANTSDYYETKKERNKELYEEVASNLETARERCRDITTGVLEGRT